ncbi:MAG: MMPL family transporter [Candidatus Hydrogenedentota bacterium]
MDNRFQNMLNPSSDEARQYEEFLETFGNDEFIIIGMTGKPILEEASLDVMLEALEALEGVPFVRMVSGIPTVYRDRFGAEDPEALADEILSTPFFHGLFINEAEDTAGLLLDTEELAKPGDREILVDGIQEALQPLRDYGFSVYVAGAPVFNVALNRLSMKESFRIFPIAATLSLIALFAALRSFRAIAAVVLCGALTLLYTFSLVGLAGKPLNVVTSMLPIILWVLAIANFIHLVCRYQYYRIDVRDAREALNFALRDVRRACVISAVTTAFGFVSLTLADIGPVAELGYLMSAGLLISLAVNLLLGPNLLLLLNVPAPRGKPVKRDHLFEALGTEALRRRGTIFVGFGMLALAGVYGASQVRTESNSLNFMPEDSETVVSYEYILNNLTGTGALEIVISTPGGWLNDSYWEPILGLKARLSELRVVPRVMSPYDFLKKVHQWDEDLDPEYYRMPDSTEHAQELLDMLEPEDKSELDRLVTANGELVRVTVMVSSMEDGDFLRVAEVAHEEITKLPEPLSAYTTGIGLRLQKMQVRMVSTQIKTFSLAFILVFICIFMGLGSFRAMLVSVLPNLVPILTVFMSMYLMDVALDAATVMVASIALGIAVDDSVHLLTAIHQEFKNGTEVGAAIVGGVVKVGASISITTTAAAIGFFTLATSSFVPVAYFGLLSSIAMITALIADFLLVPALYSIGRLIRS